MLQPRPLSRLAAIAIAVALVHASGACGVRRPVPGPVVGPAPSAATCPADDDPRGVPVLTRPHPAFYGTGAATVTLRPGRELTYADGTRFVRSLHAPHRWRHLHLVGSPIPLPPLRLSDDDPRARACEASHDDPGPPFVPRLVGHDGRPIPCRSVFGWTNRP